MSLATYMDMWCPFDGSLMRYEVDAAAERQRWYCPARGCDLEWLVIDGRADHAQVFPLTRNPHDHKGLNLSQLHFRCESCALKKLRRMAVSQSPHMQEQAARFAQRNNIREFAAFCERRGMPLREEVPTS